jgi:large subunit ribosomal protein L33
VGSSPSAGSSKIITPIRNVMAKDARKEVTLECEKCKTRGYQTDKRLKGQDVIRRIELTKYCKACKARTLHKETK